MKDIIILHFDLLVLTGLLPFFPMDKKDEKLPFIVLVIATVLLIQFGAFCLGQEYAELHQAEKQELVEF